MLNTMKDYAGNILLFTFCIIALIVFKDYGISWDEGTSRYDGIVSANYIFEDNQALLSYQDRDYGVAFELPLVIIERALKLSDSRSIFLMRHLITHFFFLISAFFCFLLIDFLYEDKSLATIGFLLVVLHPLLYAHSFFNTKDIPFMSMFLICLYINAIAFSKKQLKYFFFLGIGVGLMINIRIMGVLLFSLILIFLIIDGLNEKNLKTTFKLGLLFVSSAMVTLYITWPFLWINPFENIMLAFINMSKFRWDYTVLFDGQLVKATELNWDYIPKWFSITTPVFYLIIGLLGSVLLVFHSLNKPSFFLSNCKQRNNLLFFICFLSPVVTVIIMHSVLYDGWRQLYFIYPSFVLLCIYGLHFLYRKNVRKIIILSSFIAFINISIFMIKNHPFQHVYFNEFVDTTTPEYLRKQFELDYWGTSYKQSFEYILKHDDSPSIDVWVQNSPGLSNYDILTSRERERINFAASPNQAKYYITNYRWHPEDYESIEHAKWHSIKVGNNTINSIYKLR